MFTAASFTPPKDFLFNGRNIKIIKHPYDVLPIGLSSKACINAEYPNSVLDYRSNLKYIKDLSVRLEIEELWRKLWRPEIFRNPELYLSTILNFIAALVIKKSSIVLDVLNYIENTPVFPAILIATNASIDPLPMNAALKSIYIKMFSTRYVLLGKDKALTYSDHVDVYYISILDLMDQHWFINNKFGVFINPQVPLIDLQYAKRIVEIKPQDDYDIVEMKINWKQTHDRDLYFMEREMREKIITINQLRDAEVKLISTEESLKQNRAVVDAIQRQLESAKKAEINSAREKESIENQLRIATERNENLVNRISVLESQLRRVNGPSAAQAALLRQARDAINQILPESAVGNVAAEISNISNSNQNSNPNSNSAIPRNDLLPMGSTRRTIRR